MNNGTMHTIRAFDEDLDQLRVQVLEMGGLAEAAITASVDAMIHRDLEGALRVVENDRRIDAMELEVERLAVRLIALRAPMADDLRSVIAALKIAGVIERMGDYAKNIAKRVPVLDAAGPLEPISVLPAMGRAVSHLVKDALDAYANGDTESAVLVCQRDREIDDFYNSLFRTLLTYMMEQPHNITPSAHLLFVAKNLERIGDHATNVAEMVYYAATGEQMTERTRGNDTTANLGANMEKQA
ncbi:phosphate signaling complex protein PhoU [Sphingomonas naphthae]|uniref:Phosphate-specific transport system accessory protein PhoU n=1 Tax=Sphingomonas naphthae TaxID=1813468 RepID=A0ABY7TLY0_9SPHN|nr:phosphate signaling complex protein PhoU [Sphingomonas naphthae]WCT73986.1 phosphate signaling complex protein PhoU [Sphingomonas naphthae]